MVKKTVKQCTHRMDNGDIPHPFLIQYMTKNALHIDMEDV